MQSIDIIDVLYYHIEHEKIMDILYVIYIH